MNVVDGMLRVAVRQHSQMGSVLAILTYLIILRDLPMKWRCLLVMQCGGLEMSYLARLGGHGSCLAAFRHQCMVRNLFHCGGDRS
jgi:hypothetical protein